MPKFVIERELAGAGKLPKNELQAISQKSCGVLQSTGPRIRGEKEKADAIEDIHAGRRGGPGALGIVRRRRVRDDGVRGPGCGPGRRRRAAGSPHRTRGGREGPSGDASRAAARARSSP